MEHEFQLILSLKTPEGFTVFGEYAIGNDRDAAYALFNDLKGSEAIGSNDILHIDLIENPIQLPTKVLTKCCTLDELACNTKMVIREVFRQKNLKFYDE
jgi:hypothetical protein